MNSLLERFLAALLFLVSLALYPILYFGIKLTSKGPFIFSQQRLGKNKKIFTMYKFRTMLVNAESLKEKYSKMNESDGPTFKIRQDPRFTTFGKFLARTAIDELPQLFNVVRGEMAFVGPRPLPVAEAEKVPKKYEKRFTILPGLTSPWVVKGAHKLSFDEWMKLDIDYVNSKNIWYDVSVLLQTVLLILKSWFHLHD